MPEIKIGAQAAHYLAEHGYRTFYQNYYISKEGMHVVAYREGNGDSSWQGSSLEQSVARENGWSVRPGCGSCYDNKPSANFCKECGAGVNNTIRWQRKGAAGQSAGLEECVELDIEVAERPSITRSISLTN